jgi:hypothetical protein
MGWQKRSCVDWDVPPRLIFHLRNYYHSERSTMHNQSVNHFDLSAVVTKRDMSDDREGRSTNFNDKLSGQCK